MNSNLFRKRDNAVRRCTQSLVTVVICWHLNCTSSHFPSGLQAMTLADDSPILRFLFLIFRYFCALVEDLGNTWLYSQTMLAQELSLVSSEPFCLDLPKATPPTLHTQHHAGCRALGLLLPPSNVFEPLSN
jgi:hypothetical protein